MTGRIPGLGRHLALAAASAALLLSGAASLHAQAPAGGRPAAARPGPRGGPAEHVEARIADLHKKLAITSDQEIDFGAFAEVMRANAHDMAALFQARAQNRDVSAPGVLQWYARLTTAHADALNKLLPVFDTLYAELSAAQKQAADKEFATLRQGRPPRKAG